MKNKMMLSSGAEYILATLRSSGYRADIVGGAVRDHLIGRPSYDYDITTAATPSEVKSVFASLRTIDTGIKHGTVTLVLTDGNYEITTWRVDGDYKDNRHPDTVTFTRSLEEDLARRDFTVNAMAYNPTDGYTDLYGGMSDLAEGVIRAVGDPNKRFDEDALRIMRALRFASVLGFKLDEATSLAVNEKRHLLSNVSAERIYSELKRMLSSSGSYAVLGAYPAVIAEIIPEIEGFSLPDSSLFEGADYLSRLLSLFVGAPDPVSAYSAAMRRLKTDTDTRLIGERALALALSHSISTPTEALELLSVFGKREADAALSLGLLVGRYTDTEARIYSEALSSGIPYRISDLAVGGSDLMGLGLKGKAVGDALSELLSTVMRGECENEKGALLALVRGKAR